MKHKTTARDISYAALSVALIAVCSWISVPALTPTMVPFTMQTFAVCLVAALLGTRLGLWSVLCYLLLGAVGVPVLAEFSGGFAAILGVTGGYLLGFVFIALVVGLAVDQFGRSLPVLISSMAIGILLCYTFGTLWFVAVYTRTSGPIGIAAAVAWCVVPYLVPDAVKIVLASLITRRLYPVLNRGKSK